MTTKLTGVVAGGGGAASLLHTHIHSTTISIFKHEIFCLNVAEMRIQLENVQCKCEKKNARKKTTKRTNKAVAKHSQK